MKIKVLVLLLLIIFLGAGCVWFKDKVADIPKIVPSGPRLADFDGLTPEQAAKNINFVPGSQIELRQTYLGIGAKLADSLAGDDKEGVRIITLERFAPFNYANLSWKLSRRVETQESVSAREEYEGENQNQPIGQVIKTNPPETETEMVAVQGGLEDINLDNAHALYLPAYWPSERASAQSTSAIWLSEDVYKELTTTRNSTIYYGILDENLFGAMKLAKQFADSVAALKNKAQQESKNTEVELVRADEDFTDWTLKVNGQDITVQVFKARNWFGEMVVLNNPQNPLILKVTLNPLALGALDLLDGGVFLQSLLGYEVTRLEGVQ